jgi:lipopolysaccharide/colanic/teichoic acid biosynthesis glycosyltransferase
MTIQFTDYTATIDHRRDCEAVLPSPTVRSGFYASTGKRLLDFALAVMSLPVVLPLVGICVLLVALNGGAPFYRQRRIGRYGKVFYMLKIRTMVADADHVLEDHLAANPALRREWDEKQKLCCDPRITRIGSVLRKTSLDELPQLWNVLRGEMSLVGPRPMMIKQEMLYPGLSYYRMRPGITGLWQVSERNESSFAERATFDADYYRQLSLKTDLSILVRTVKVVLRATGY